MENMTWRDFEIRSEADYPSEQWFVALTALHKGGDAGKDELISMLRSKWEDNAWVRKAVLEVMQPLRGLSWGWKRNLPKIDRRWPMPSRRALAAALERAHIIRSHGRPTTLHFNPPEGMRPLKDYVPDIEEQEQEIYRDNKMPNYVLLRPVRDP
jgi:hypothetical protein